MTDPEILKDAPKGATNADNDGGYWLISSQDKPQAYFYGSWSYCEPREDIRSLADIKRIVELEKYRDIRDLEQQARGLEDLHKSVEKCGAKSLMSFLLIEEADELRTQAKALKEQVKP